MSATRPSRVRQWGTLGVLGVFLFWAYWPTLADMERRWSQEAMYSHGYLVPLFAAVLLYLRRDLLAGGDCDPSWWGVPFVLLGLVMRLGAGYSSISSPERFSLLPTLVGVCVGLGGWRAFRWAWPGIAFLFFMLPLPAGVDQFLSGPLQHMATVASAHALQTLGFIAEAEGNVIVLSDGDLGVVEACSGLRMFVTFCALATAMAVVMKGSWVRRVIVLASAFPLALLCNVARITATGVVRQTLGAGPAEAVHDWAGWSMIVLALILLGIELKVLDWLFVARDDIEPSPAPRATGGDARGRVAGPVAPKGPAASKVIVG